MVAYRPDPALVDRVASSLVGFERDFFKRVWNPGLEVYRSRLDAIGFSGHERVLDCGTGMGQWLVALAERNVRVDGIEYEKTRVDAVNALIKEVGIPNANVLQGVSEEMPYGDGLFDAVFAYGMVFLTDTKRTIRELSRVLKPGGRVFLTANGVGWFSFLLIEEHNKSPHYDPRQIAADSFQNTLNYLTGGGHKHGAQLVIPPDTMERWLVEGGFGKFQTGPEGSLHAPGKEQPTSFYKHKDYLGHAFVYEVLCEKHGV
jgi:SAM-dependent methyltransferase